MLTQSLWGLKQNKKDQKMKETKDGGFFGGKGYQRRMLTFSTKQINSAAIARVALKLGDTLR